jgi:hypothetical protein
MDIARLPKLLEMDSLTVAIPRGAFAPKKKVKSLIA